METFVVRVTSKNGNTSEKHVRMASAYAAIRYARSLVHEGDRLVVQHDDSVVFLASR